VSFHARRIDDKKRRRKNPVEWRKALGVGVLLARPLLAFGKQVKKKVEERHEKEARAKRLLTLSFASILVVVILALALALLIKVGAVSLSTIAEKSGAPLLADSAGVTNILLMGQGNEDHDGIDLTDTIMVASIDHSSVVLLSLPRDLYFLHTEKMGAAKLNTFWRDYRITLQREGKPREQASMLSLKEVTKEVGVALNLPMHYAMKVDFTAFEEIVDALGGVDIEVPEAIDDLEYPGLNYSFEPFHIEAGLQHMDGKTALKYARTRHTSSDFDRSARQQVILQALSEKARSSGFLTKPRKISALLSILSEHLETDLTLREMISLAGIGMELPRENVVSMQLNNVNGLYGEPIWPGGFLYAPPRDLFEGAAVLLPVSIPEFPVTWKQIHLFSNYLFHHRTLYLKKAGIAVFNAGAPDGTARKLAGELTKFGFEVTHVGNLPGKQKVDTSFLTKNASSMPREHVTFFSDLFSLKESPLPEDAKAEGGDLSIVLGKDFTFKPFQELAQ
jgi:LCP family protein required for cell wall assembly